MDRQSENFSIHSGIDNVKAILFWSACGLCVFTYVIMGLSSFGYFQEGIAGLVLGTFVARAGYVLLIAFLLRFCFKNIKTKRGKTMWGIFCVIGVLASFLMFRSPVLDVQYLNDCKTIELENAYMSSDSHRKFGHYYKLTGYDAAGKKQIFYVNKKRYKTENKLLEEKNGIVTIKCLPYTEIIMDLEYGKQTGGDER